MIKIILALMLTFSSFSLFAAEKKKKIVYRKTQDVNFSGSDVDGMARTPDGAYLQHRKAMKFIPLYKIKSGLRSKIKDSVEYLR